VGRGIRTGDLRFMRCSPQPIRIRFVSWTLILVQILDFGRWRVFLDIRV
jgi:hypothetical protein